jgi:NOL1/NOP2/fmu family ribosome biogenesis protein
LDDSWTFSELEETDLQAEWPTIAVHPDAALEAMDGIILGEDATRDWSHGKAIVAAGDSTGWMRVYDASGRWLGIAKRDICSLAWQPYKVISEAA